MFWMCPHLSTSLKLYKLIALMYEGIPEKILWGTHIWLIYVFYKFRKKISNRKKILEHYCSIIFLIIIDMQKLINKKREIFVGINMNIIFFLNICNMNVYKLHGHKHIVSRYFTRCIYAYNIIDDVKI